MKNSYLTVTDQFCGAGGSSIGATNSGAEVKLAMNHWQLAVETHNTNFPNVQHDTADISAVNPRRYPSTNILITSPECTNHSLAKGKPRRFYANDLFGNVLIDPSEERSRATMWDVPRFAEYHDYEIIVVENVVDAGKWRLWDSWIHAMHALGYDHQAVYYNSMFAWPTPQSRDRLYTVFWKHNNTKPDLDFRPVAHCDNCEINVEAIQTWKKQKVWGRYKAQYFYRCPVCTREVFPFYYAAFNAIDWTIPAERIGDRKKPLKPKTIERIKYGLEKYGRTPMVVTGRYTTGIDCRVRDAIIDPFPTQPGDASHSVVFPWLVETGYTDDNKNRSSSVIQAGNTQTARQSIGLVAPSFIAELHGESKAGGVNEPLMCVTAGGGHHGLLSSDAFLSYYYGTQQASNITDPIRTITGKDRAGLVGSLEALTVDDLTFRMLKSNEVGSAMAFPRDYVVLGTEKERVKQYGNAVTPPAMKLILDRCITSLNK
jgi:DNA (cytosine-5)-methyltransferase 1